MYTLVSAFVKERNWLAKDLSQLSISQITSQYEEAYLRVSSPYWPVDRTMLFSEITKNYLNTNHTLAQLFASMGNTTLPSTNGIASISTGRVKYADAYWAGYSVRGALEHGNGVKPVKPSEAKTIVLSKPGVNGFIFHKNCLVSVNGLLHRTDADNDRVYIVDGGISTYHANRNEIGIINFRSIGALTQVPITEDMLFKTHPSQPYANQIFLKAPVDTKDKTVALVFGGYLHLLDNLTFFRVGENSFCIDTQSIPLVERFIESRALIDLSSLDISFAGKHQAQFSKEELFSDQTLAQWLLLSQSFLLVIDSPAINVERETLPPTNLAKEYFTNKDNRLPLVIGYGLLAPYWKYEDDNIFSISVGDKIRPNYLFRTTPPANVPNPADNCEPYNPRSYSIAQFLDITSEKIVITPNS